MIIGKQILKNAQLIAKSSSLAKQGKFNFFSQADENNNNDLNYFEQSGLKADLLNQKTKEQVLVIQKQRNNQMRKQQGNDGILSSQEQKQLFYINNNLLKQFEESNDKNEEENTKAHLNHKSQNQKENQDEIQKQISLFLGHGYDGKIKDDFFLFLNALTEEKVNQLEYYQVCTFILENGRNPHRKKFKFVYKKTLTRLMNRFMELTPLNKIINHLESNNKQFDRSNFSVVEYEFLRTTLPQIIISLQNCGFYDNALLEQYFKIFSSRGFQENSHMMVKTIVGLMWSYVKFNTQVDYTFFIDYLFRQENHVIFINSLRLLWLLTTHFDVVDNSNGENQQENKYSYNQNKITQEQLEKVKQLFIKKLEKQNLVILNNKNSVQLLQIIYKLYPQHAVQIASNYQKTIDQISEQDNFFKKIYPFIQLAQSVIRYKHQNQSKLKVIIYDQRNNSITEHIKQQTLVRSTFEQNVLAVLKNMNPSLSIRQNVYIGDAYEVDFLIDSHNIVIEINGDSHYYFDNSTGKIKLFAKTLLKQEILKLFGIRNIVNINQFHWYKLTSVEEMEEYIINQLKYARVDIKIFKQPNNSEAGEKPKVQFASQKLQNIQ